MVLRKPRGTVSKSVEHARSATGERSVGNQSELLFQAQPRGSRILLVDDELDTLELISFNLIDAGRLWFKSEIGLGVREAPLDTWTAAEAILQHDLLVVKDLQSDERFAGNPLLAFEPPLRFYAGASVEEAAEAMGVSPRTINREWTYARAWLFRVLKEQGWK